MVKRTKQNATSEITQLNETETLTSIKPISQLLSKRNSKENQSDDLIVSLSDAYENKRARQVFEWEKLRRQSLQRAA